MVDVESMDDAGTAYDEVGLESLLDFLHRSRGFDFTGYKRASLVRRIRRRMQAVGIDSFTTYLDHLEVHPDEFPQLFNMLLINVTAFFRDPAAWEALAARIPTIVDPNGQESIRVWSAGCSSGEEPYTLAMILCEALGQDAFSSRAKIYATDVDEDALAHARQATYPLKALEGVPPELVEKYFVRSGSNYVVHKELRRAVIFGRHDLVQDAPIPKVDVLACRNSLMYFNAETQTRILQRLQFALNPSGVLFLGKAEMLLTHADLFAPVDLKLRLFARAAKSIRPRLRHLDAPKAGPPSGRDESQAQLQRATFDASPIAQILIDTAGRAAMVNERAVQLFSLALTDLGRPFHDLEVSYRPAELRSCIDKVRLERRAISLKDVERVLPNTEKTYLDIEVRPLVGMNGLYLGAQVSFTDVTSSHRVQHELRRANTNLEAAHAELQSTSEELETTNAELQSMVEELDTTNEELQATNEELETMNEELQATNEELQTINAELRQRGAELNQRNAFHGSVLASLRAGVAVLDGELHVRAWSSKMEDLWGVRADEVERKDFLNLDIGVPIDRIAGSLRACLANGETAEQELECTSRKGKNLACSISMIPLVDGGNKGVVVLIEEVRG
jgi:two-component system CheB/CheR fusion protein